ncbi:helix-turn-helix domain-containing protein [Celeribacter persicus]|uniref:XRE family transcriptional regulator n=1 Tax=Celeribacter persicus TaxID=1651082 RepID=A0A2T5HUN8_9RHOB|nr:XRE family transcriptional regulator [Celeribacter persicus]PTQ75307.1 XRE family transcriptional regulator [Celeribacter persicus]
MSNKELTEKLGTRLREWRTVRGLTLSQVSESTGVAPSSLSKIENGLVSVSYHTLKRICDGLGMPIEDIINPQHRTIAPGRRTVTRDQDVSYFSCPQYIYGVHGTDISRKEMIPLEMEVLARSPDDFDAWNRHEGEELIYVLSGEIEAHTEFYAPTRLKAGESMYFDSSMGHMYVSVGDQNARILSVCYDPRAAQDNLDDFLKATPMENKD